MAYDFFDFGNSDSSTTTLQIEGSKVELPDATYVRDAAIVRDGADLVLDGPNGTVTVEGYFNAAEAPDLVTPEGYTLTPELVDSFARSPSQFAQSDTMNDVSPVGAVDEMSGEASITRLDGSVEPITIGTPIYQGDVIETSADGAVNISFIDETSFAVSEEARLAIDEYVFDPMTEAGTQNFSVLKGVFVFTSGLIGRDDPDDVNIDTPSGSIGIRGTIIAGNVDTGEITVVEGAIVVRDHLGNEVTLDQQFETALMPSDGGVENMGLMPARDVADRFDPVSRVSPTLFSSINDAIAEEGTDPQAPEEPTLENTPEDVQDDGATQETQPNIDGSIDQNNDNDVDSTIDDGAAPVGEEAVEDEAAEAAEPVDGDAVDGEAVDGTTGEAAQPRTTTTTTQLGSDPMGMNNGGMGSPTAGSAPATSSGSNSGTAAGADAVQAMKAAPPPPPPGTHTLDSNQDPETIIPPTGDGAVGSPPLHILSNLGSTFEAGQVNIAPSDAATTNYFRVSEGQSLDYHFDLEFEGSATTFQLSAQSAADLGAKFGAWSFNTSGHLSVNAANTISDTNTGTVADDVIMIDVIATNAGGQTTASYALQLYAPGGNALADDTVLDGQVLKGTPTVDSYNIGIAGDGANNNIILAGNGNDILTLVRGSGNEIHLGDGQNSVWIQGLAANTGNEIYGGLIEDSVKFDNAHNSFFGMDGDDVFKLELGSIADSQLGSGSSAGYVADLGHSSFNAAQDLDYLGFGYDHAIDNGGFGDTLYIEGTGGSLDFASSIADDYFRGVERLDAKHSGVAANVTLNYNDVIEMTDYKNTLIIRADGNDNLTFSGFGGAGMQKVADDVNSINDDYDGGGAATSGTFDVWSDGTVTLIVEDTGASITGLP